MEKTRNWDTGNICKKNYSSQYSLNSLHFPQKTTSIYTSISKINKSIYQAPTKCVSQKVGAIAHPIIKQKMVMVFKSVKLLEHMKGKEQQSLQ